MSPSPSSPAKPKRRWRFQFSLRTMLLVTLLLALLLGWLAEKMEVAWKQQRAAEAILSLGGRVYYECQGWPSTPVVVGVRPATPRKPRGPKSLRRLLGEHFFSRAAVVVYPKDATNEDLKYLDDLPYLTGIHLHCANVTGAGLSHVWKHEGLRSLGFRGVSISDADVANLEALTQLESLELCHTPITDKAVDTLRRLPNLESVQLEGTLVSHEAGSSLPNVLHYGDEETWAPAPSEEQRQIAVALERDGAHVSCRRRLDATVPEYSVTWFQTSMEGRKLDLMERLEALRGLILARMSIDNEHWARIAGGQVSVSGRAQAGEPETRGSKGLTRLGTLVVREVPVTDDDMLHIKKLVHLKVLYLRDTRVTDAGLAHLPSLGNVECLGLEGPGFTDVGLAHLAGLPNLRNLELFGSQFTDDGLKHVGALSQLDALSLWANATITDAGLAHLAGLENLNHLSIHNRNVTDAGLAHVAKLTSLTYLWVSDAQVSGAGLEHVRKLPRLESGSVNDTNVIEPVWQPELE